MEVNILPSGLYNVIWEDIKSASYLTGLQDLKISCASSRLLEGLNWGIPWEDGDEDEIEGYENIHSQVRTLFMSLWMDGGFTHFQDHSVANRSLEFRMWREQKTEDAVGPEKMASSSC